jgi:hypothetical protein
VLNVFWPRAGYKDSSSLPDVWMAFLLANWIVTESRCNEESYIPLCLQLAVPYGLKRGVSNLATN